MFLLFLVCWEYGYNLEFNILEVELYEVFLKFYDWVDWKLNY